MILESKNGAERQPTVLASWKSRSLDVPALFSSYGCMLSAPRGGQLSVDLFSTLKTDSQRYAPNGRQPMRVWRQGGPPYGHRFAAFVWRQHTRGQAAAGQSRSPAACRLPLSRVRPQPRRKFASPAFSSANRSEAPLRRNDLPWLSLVVLFGGVLGPGLLMLGLATTQAAAGSLLLNTERPYRPVDSVDNENES